jgi:hypothetical protein
VTVNANQLNLQCACESVGTAALPGFYSNAPVFVSATQARQMRQLVSAVHRVVALPGWRTSALEGASTVTRHQPRTLGVFTGFDFHVGADGPKLIEINTNAGGAMLNAVAEWRNPECCNESNPAVRVPASRALIESGFLAMFRNEWRLARGTRTLRTVAIVDDHPEAQFLLPEFRLFEGLFRAHGIDAVIVDAAELACVDGELRHAGRTIDLVYNRLTDFDFAEPAHAALRDAWLSDAAVITPHPHAHAMFADKRNLVRLTSADFLASIGASEDDIESLLAFIPLTREVDRRPEAWWQDRKEWFFKPSAGFGSRGAYRGDKLTRRVFSDVLDGTYVAQRIAPPGERLRNVSGIDQLFKVDVRHYVYDGISQLMAARLYQGQTTNFRTAGGGFAPVIELLDVFAA